jgi:hypothetical protein
MARIIATVMVAAALLMVSAAAALPEIANPADFANQTFRLVTADPTVIGNYTVLNHSAAVPSAFPHVVAEMISNESYDQLGWDFVQVTANEALLQSDDRGYRAYYAAGYLEGYVTSTRIGQIYVGNNLTYPQPPLVMGWIARHVAYMSQQASDNMNAGYPSPFWTQLGNHLAQMEGIAAGYMASLTDSNRIGATNQPNMTFMDIFILNFNNELGDIWNIMNVSSMEATQSPEPPRRKTAASSSSSSTRMPFRNGNLHCSALVKATSDDIFFSHVTWGGYNTMLRQYKIYRFQTTVSMSAVAGTIASGDDWYHTSNMMAIQETTNDYYNNALFQYVVPETASEFLRVMVGTFLATSGPEWVELFQYNNSGTYCNQWMVLDYKLYTRGDLGDAMQDNLLWVAEQIPGNVTSADVTPILRDASYWASFNIPYFPNIYNVSGFEQLFQEYGPVFSYTKYARPEIFKRNQTDVRDLTSMRAMMRYNNWQHDTLSWIPECSNCTPRGSPWLAISSRGDLVNATVLPVNPSYAMQFMRAPMGGIDSKITSYSMMIQGMGNVICGPTYDQQPVFNFDVAFPGNRPPGSANIFDFPWSFFNVVGQSGSAPTGNGNDSRDVIIGVCIGVPVALLAVSFVVYRYRRNMDDGGAYVPVNQENVA